jgi:hypothetical protein
MAIHRHAAWLLLGWVLAGGVSAFEIGDREKGRARPGTHYGNPVHEDMTRASRTLARSASPELQCKPSVEQLDLLLNTRIRGRVSSAMCCHPGAKATLCPQLVHGKAPVLMAQFAYKVADGSLSPDLTLGQAVEALPLTVEGKARFASGFESYYAYSSSHVRREREATWPRPAPRIIPWHTERN